MRMFFLYFIIETEENILMGDTFFGTIVFETVVLYDPQHNISSTQIINFFQLTSPKANITTLVKPYAYTYPGSLFSEYQSCRGRRFIGPPKLPLWSLPHGGQVWPI